MLANGLLVAGLAHAGNLGKLARSYLAHASQAAAVELQGTHPDWLLAHVIFLVDAQPDSQRSQTFLLAGQLDHHIGASVEMDRAEHMRGVRAWSVSQRQP